MSAPGGTGFVMTAGRRATIWRNGRRGGSKRQSRLAAACHQVSSANLKFPGAGEGIRTLDPDLGKVVLYH
jgi:hypothetical protein